MINDDAIGGFLVGMCIGAVAVMCSVLFTCSHWEQQAIKHGVAGYDKTTGEFKWNQPPAENE